MSGLGDAMTKAIKRRIENAPQPTTAEKARAAGEAQKRLGFGKEPPKTRPEADPGDHEFR